MIKAEDLENKFLIIYDDSYPQRERTVFYGFVYNVRFSKHRDVWFRSVNITEKSSVRTEDLGFGELVFEDEPKRWFVNSLL